MLKVGDPFPNVTLQGTMNGETMQHTLAPSQKYQVLVFFPFAFTPVWTRELPDASSKIDEFRARNAEVFGVSVDSVHTNKAYAREMGGLSYPILSDWLPHGGLTRQLGIWLEEKGCASRTTVIVDPAGTIRHISTNPLGEDRDFTQVFTVLDQLVQEGASATAR